VLEGEVAHWWEDDKRIIRRGVEQLSWEKFVTLFYKEYFSFFARQENEMQCMTLQQGSMIVAQYHAKFTVISRFAPHSVR